MTFLKSGGQLWALQDYWTRVGFATGHSAVIVDFNWSHAHISVSNFAFSSNFDCNCGVFFIGNLWSLGLFVVRHFCFGWK